MHVFTCLPQLEWFSIFVPGHSEHTQWPSCCTNPQCELWSWTWHNCELYWSQWLAILTILLWRHQAYCSSAQLHNFTLCATVGRKGTSNMMNIVTSTQHSEHATNLGLPPRSSEPDNSEAPCPHQIIIIVLICSTTAHQAVSSHCQSLEWVCLWACPVLSILYQYQLLACECVLVTYTTQPHPPLITYIASSLSYSTQFNWYRVQFFAMSTLIVADEVLQQPYMCQPLTWMQLRRRCWQELSRRCEILHFFQNNLLRPWLAMFRKQLLVC